MDDSETYMNVNFTKTDALSPSGAEPEVSYAELNVKSLSAPRVRIDGDGLNSTYSELNFRKEEPRIDDDEGPPFASGPGGLSATAQTGVQKQEPKQNVGNRPDRKFCLLCLITFTFVVIVFGLSIYEQNYWRLWEQHQELNRSQRQYQQQVHELNATLEYRISENSLLVRSQRSCQNNLSALNNNFTILEKNLAVINSELSDLNRTHSDLHHQLNQLEIKSRHINDTKDQICQYLTRSSEPTCSQDWIKNENRCYFISNIRKSYAGAREHCSEIDSSLLEINSEEEKTFVSNAVHQYGTYWIGKCADGNVASYLLYKYYERRPCRKCDWSSGTYSCRSKYRFICEKSARSYPDIPEEIRGLCQQQVGPTSINSVATFLQQGVQNRTRYSTCGIADVLYDWEVTFRLSA